MTTRKEIEGALRNPIAWTVGGIVSVLTVLATIGFDPFGITAGLLSVVFTQATSLFTAGSILGFTIAPNVDWIPAMPFQLLAIAFGIVVVGKILDRVWDSFKARVLED